MPMNPFAFHPRLSTGLVLSKNKNEFVRLPLARSVRKANVRILEAGSLHDFLEKVCE
jgi:hypothetical protein